MVVSISIEVQSIKLCIWNSKWRLRKLGKEHLASEQERHHVKSYATDLVRDKISSPLASEFAADVLAAANLVPAARLTATRQPPPPPSIAPLSSFCPSPLRPDHQVQGIKDIVSSKRREIIERGLTEKSKKGEHKKLVREGIGINKSVDMLIDSPQWPPPPPPPVVVDTSSSRKQKSISSITNTTLLVDDDQVSNQYNISSSST
ncbi:hypothetical protein H5410_051865 [Solanum commersonii]|uniref:Uncharacterized protein n=1 Tax=Solanum commersonii TaxID=4109 RepID=A0A9J5X1Z2_SOLCO|nr:hypothetical protein H5410_051865 [Solanum commersonii]